jgi:spermidine synthase
MYHVIGTGITIIILYLISYFFYSCKIYSLQFHRKLWNIILAAAFILTALAGLFLALQTNYKWEIPVIKTILKWHVEIGIGLAITGLFHFFWHLSYFVKIFRKEETSYSAGNYGMPKTETDIATNLFIIGFVSSSVQLLLLREIMNITGGYELIAGAFLCSWLIGSAAGSGLASKSSLSDIRKINLYFSTGPLISIILMLLLSRLFLKPGETPSFLAGIVFTGLVLIPFCLISGFTFIKLLSAGTARNYIPGKSFSIETAGGIIAGIVISVLSAGILNTYQSLFLIITLGISFTLLTYCLTGRTRKIIFKTAVLIFSALIIVSSPDKLCRQFLLRGIRVSETDDTPYGNITRGEYHNETSTYYNQRLLIYSNDAIESEEDIHYAMLQVENPDNILLISGPVSSRLKEINKYHVHKVVYVERDPALIEMIDQEDKESESVLRIENKDAFSYVRKCTEKYDAVIMLLPPPSSLSLNRYYTLEFFTEVKRKMNWGAVFSCSPGINPNYFNKESVNLYSSIYNSLRAVFKNVIPVSGNKLYFIASDKDLSTFICQLTEEKNINNIYVGPDYLSDDLITAKSEEVISLLDSSVKTNRTTLPIACFFYQSFNLSKNLNEKTPAIVLMVALFALSLKALRRDNGIMYFSALSLAGYEIILLLLLQVTVGNMYQVTGLIIAGLMTGLAVGAGINMPLINNKPFLKVILLITLYIIIGLTSGKIMTMNSRFVVIGLLVISGFCPAVITGNFFRELTSTGGLNSNPSRVYSADLAGSAVGFIAFSGLAIPLLGISVSIFFLPVLIFTGFLFTTIGNKRWFY